MQCGEGLSAATPRPVLEPHALASFRRPRHRAAFICLGVVPLDIIYYRRVLVLIQFTLCTIISLYICVYCALELVFLSSYNSFKKEVDSLPLHYKIDILSALKSAGYTTYRIRQEGLLSQSTLQKLRQGVGVSWENIETICRLLQCQPGDIIEYTKREAGE